MSLSNFWRKEADALRDTSVLLGSKNLLLDTSGLNAMPSEKRQVTIKRCEEALSNADFFEIKSRTAEKMLLEYLTNNSTERAAFLKNLDTRVKKIDKEGSPQESNETNETAKTALKIGWKDWKIKFDITKKNELIKMIYDSMSGYSAIAIQQNAVKLKKGFSDEFKEYYEQDKKWLNELNKPTFKSSMQSFFETSIWNKAQAILKNLFMFIDEQAEIVNRYDSIYQTDDFLKALDLNPYTRFYPAEIKAVNMQETADFTDLAIAGIKATESGIPKKSQKKQSSYVGIAQLKTSTSVADAKKVINRLLSENKINTSTYEKWKNLKPDVSSDAVVLFALYLIETERLLINELGESWNEISCVDRKKFVICGFNTGFSDVADSIKELKLLTFSNEIVELIARKAQKRANGSLIKYNEVKKYTFEIIERLRGFQQIQE
jgi:hypothetical protein